jgi:NitT/TauT family transport system ATP-binding protein
MELLALVKLQGFENRYPYELSGGMQQRVAIARALLSDPAMILMDEPFGALDAMTREEMNLELLAIWARSRKTVVLITHSIQEAVFLSDRVVVLSGHPGRVVDVVDIDLPRPRTFQMLSAPEFGLAANRLRDQLMARGGTIE